MKNVLCPVFLMTCVLLAGCGAGDAGEDAGDSGVMDAVADDVSIDGLEPDAADATGHDTPDLDVHETDALADAAVDTSDAPEFDPTLSGTLALMLKEHVAFSPDPGVTLTVRTADGAMWSGAAGVSDIAGAIPMTPDSSFRVGSNTKPIIAVVVLQLIEEGKILIDEPLTTYLPQYPGWSDITIRMLLNMRSGLKDFLAVTACLLEILFAPDTAVTPGHIVDFVYNDTDNGRLFAVDTDGKYSNTNYVLLGLIIEQVTGNTAEYEIDERVLKPVGMDHTYLDMGDTDDPALAKGYIDFSLAGTALGVKPSQAAMIPNATFENGLLIGTNLIHPTVTWTSGALVSTSEDMTKFVHELMAAHLFSEDTLSLMTQTQGAQLFNGIVQYGLGLQVRPTNQGDSVGHGGLNFGYQAATYFFPDNGITISHLHNFLLDSYDTFQDDVMKMVLAGGDPDFTPCLAPDGLYRDGSGGTFLNIAFKGVVNDIMTSARTIGTGSFRLVDDTGIRPVSGIFPSAVAGTTSGNPNVTITGYGLPAEGDASLTILNIIFGQDLWGGLSAEGRKNIEFANAADAFVLTSEAWYANGTSNVEKVCYTGVSNVAKTGEVFLCPDSRTMPGSGGYVRVMASLPYSTDAAYLNQVLTNLGLDLCDCWNGTAWAACEP